MRLRKPLRQSDDLSFVRVYVGLFTDYIDRTSTSKLSKYRYFLHIQM